MPAALCNLCKEIEQHSINNGGGKKPPLFHMMLCLLFSFDKFDDECRFMFGCFASLI